MTDGRDDRGDRVAVEREAGGARRGGVEQRQARPELRVELEPPGAARERRLGGRGRGQERDDDERAGERHSDPVAEAVPRAQTSTSTVQATVGSSPSSVASTTSGPAST